VYFQVTAIKIQLSCSIKKYLEMFYKENSEIFNFLLNTNETQFKKFLNREVINAQKGENSLAIYAGRDSEEWYNFNLVDNKAIPFLSGLFKELNIIKP
jgi:hypothetical protein